MAKRQKFRRTHERTKLQALQEIDPGVFTRAQFQVLEKNTVLTKAQDSSPRRSPMPDRIHEGTGFQQPKKIPAFAGRVRGNPEQIKGDLWSVRQKN